MEELRRRMSSAKAWGIEAELVTPEFVKEKVPFLDTDQIIGAFWTPGVGVVDSLRAGTIMRERAHGDGRADRRTQRRGHRPRRRGRSDQAGADHRRRHRGRVRRDRVRRVEPEDRRHGRGHDRADAGRAPDDLRRAVPAAGRARGRDLVPDRPRHGHVLLRAPARRRHGGRLLRAPRDPARAGGHPLDRPGQAVADRDAVHRGRLRPAARAGLRADARAARRRGRGDALRDQRPAVADRATAPRSSARARSRASGSRPRCGSRRAPASAARSPSG